MYKIQLFFNVSLIVDIKNIRKNIIYYHNVNNKRELKRLINLIKYIDK